MNRKLKRFLFKALAIVRPDCWFRVTETNEDWDNRLWDLLETQPIKFIGRYDALIGDTPVWIANHPYASGSSKKVIHGKNSPAGREGVEELSCSRATSLLLGRRLRQSRISASLYHPGVTHLWLEDGTILS